MVKSSLARKKVVRKTRKHMKRGKVGKNKTHRKKSTKKALKKRSRRNTLKRKKSRKIKRGGFDRNKNHATRRKCKDTDTECIENVRRELGISPGGLPEPPRVNPQERVYVELDLPPNPNPSAMGVRVQPTHSTLADAQQAPRVRPSQTVYSQVDGTTTQGPF